MEAQDLKQIFSSGGLIAQDFPRYEYRSQQLELAVVVKEAIREKRHLIAEAPTGVGKSFAYSVPLIYEVLAFGQRVVISTNTISLQEQLTKKDIPFLQKVLPKKFKVVLVKGRASYLCPRKAVLSLPDFLSASPTIPSLRRE